MTGRDGQAPLAGWASCRSGKDREFHEGPSVALSVCFGVGGLLDHGSNYSADTWLDASKPLGFLLSNLNLRVCRTTDPGGNLDLVFLRAHVTIYSRMLLTGASVGSKTL